MIGVAPVEIAAGANLPNSVADVSVSAPEEWETLLRSISPINEAHSHLRFYWYRAASRWVLYDCVPRALIHEDELQGAPIMGGELLARLEGIAPRDRTDADDCPYVSDVQHEFYRLYRVYARPFWVLQGDGGGHQVRFSPWQKNVLAAQGLPDVPPSVGALPACPFDNRAVAQLRHLNRLLALDNRLDRLQASGSAAVVAAEFEGIQKEIRDAEMRFIEQQMTPIVEAMATIQGSSAHQKEVIYTSPGAAARATDALQEYLETGNYSL